MRGIELEFGWSINNYLLRVLHHLNTSDYTWHIVDQSIYPEWKNEEEFGKSNEPLFPETILSGEEFLKCIDNRYFIMHVTIEAYPVGSQIVEIRNYNDFLNSDCFLFFLCVDRTNAFIYCKDQNMLREIMTECNDVDIFYKRDITDENDNVRLS